MHCAKPWSVACLSGRAQVLLLSEYDQPLYKDAGVEPADRLTHRNWPVVGSVCGVTLLEYGCHQRGLPGLWDLASCKGSIEKHQEAWRQQVSWLSPRSSLRHDCHEQCVSRLLTMAEPVAESRQPNAQRLVKTLTVFPGSGVIRLVSMSCAYFQFFTFFKKCKNLT